MKEDNENMVKTLKLITKDRERTNILRTVEPVSYTHLDVYKRQAVSQPFMLSMFIFIGGLRGAGDTRWTLAITMAGFWGIRVIAAYLLAIKLDMGLYGAWIGMALDLSLIHI